LIIGPEGVEHARSPSATAVGRHLEHSSWVKSYAVDISGAIDSDASGAAAIGVDNLLGPSAAGGHQLEYGPRRSARGCGTVEVACVIHDQTVGRIGAIRSAGKTIEDGFRPARSGGTQFENDA